MPRIARVVVPDIPQLNFFSSPTLLPNFLFITFLIFAFIFCANKISDPDTWWHIKTGEIIFTTKHIPKTDPFSYPMQDKIWIVDEWLGEYLLYCVYRLFYGFNGLSIFTAAISAFIFLILFQTSKIYKANPYITIIILFLSLFAAKPRLLARPDIFSLLLTVTYLYILAPVSSRWSVIDTREKRKKGKKEKNSSIVDSLSSINSKPATNNQPLRRLKPATPYNQQPAANNSSQSAVDNHQIIKSPIFLLPFLQILWANIHPSAILGIVLIAISFITRLLTNRPQMSLRGAQKRSNLSSKDTSVVWAGLEPALTLSSDEDNTASHNLAGLEPAPTLSCFLILILSAALSLLNPYSTHIYTAPFELTSMQSFMKYINEWQPITFSKLVYSDIKQLSTQKPKNQKTEKLKNQLIQTGPSPVSTRQPENSSTHQLINSIHHRLSTINYQLSTINHLSPTSLLHLFTIDDGLNNYRILLLLVFISTILTIKKQSLHNIFLLALFTIMSLKAQRFISLFALAAAPITASNISLLTQQISLFLPNPNESEKKLSPRRHEDTKRILSSYIVYSSFLRSAWERKLSFFRTFVPLWQKFSYHFWSKTSSLSPFVFKLCFSLVFIFIIYRSTFQNPKFKTNFGAGADINSYPYYASLFVEKNNLRGNMYNYYGYGGFLIWQFAPYRKVFVDGRCPIYGAQFFNELILPDGNTAPIYWDNLSNKYNFNYAIVATIQTKLQNTLLNHPDWALVFWDDTAMVFLKRTSQNQNLIKTFEFKYTNPTKITPLLQEIHEYIKKSQNTEHRTQNTELSNYQIAVISELERVNTSSKNTFLACKVLSFYFYAVEDYKKSICFLKKSIKINPKSSASYVLLGDIYLKLKEPKKAEEMFEKANFR